MASDAQETLYKIFAALSGNRGAVLSSPAAVLSGELMSPLAQAAAGGASKPEQGSKDAGSTAATVAMDVLKSGFGLVTLVTSLFGLFGGGGGEPATPPPLVK